ncbi:hypothetical protein [Luteococcus japonicus]|uniref:hypothetical protein n=1 Tax=Luteococcus japonicus TaxID=33984 RepID=UPI0011CEB083|nr:hypothetical protein [Luteococcus japonicus]
MYLLSLINQRCQVRQQHQAAQQQVALAFIQEADRTLSKLSATKDPWGAMGDLFAASSAVELICPPSVGTAARTFTSSLVDALATGTVPDAWDGARERFIREAQPLFTTVQPQVLG